MNTPPCTLHAPAERASKNELQRQVQCLSESDLMLQLLNSMLEYVMILNRQRQIVFANQTLLDYLHPLKPGSIIGLRPGEALHCVHAFETEGGCGTTDFCTVCGAVNAIISAQDGIKCVEECHVMREIVQGLAALDLRVRAAPFEFSSEHFIVLGCIDISDEKRRRELERIFFHDILNIATPLPGFAKLLTRAEPEKAEEYKQLIYLASKRLIGEIEAQKMLLEVESKGISVHPEKVVSTHFLQNFVSLYAKQGAARESEIRIDPEAEKVVFFSDPKLLGRVIGNMLKNALEAIQPCEAVSLGCRVLDNGIQFHVHNPGFIPRNVQLQLFHKSFSTKGQGRGLGTYSIKMLSEKYLRGKVSFTSTPEEGTTFTAWFPLKDIQ